MGARQRAPRGDRRSRRLCRRQARGRTRLGCSRRGPGPRGRVQLRLDRVEVVMSEPFDQDQPSRYYETDPRDPDAPHVLDEYRGLRSGMRVRHTRPPDLDGPLTIDEIVTFDGDDGFTSAILN